MCHARHTIKIPGLFLLRKRAGDFIVRFSSFVIPELKKERAHPLLQALNYTNYSFTKARTVDLAAFTASNWASVMVMTALPSAWHSVGRVS